MEGGEGTATLPLGYGVLLVRTRVRSLVRRVGTVGRKSPVFGVVMTSSEMLFSCSRGAWSSWMSAMVWWGSIRCIGSVMLEQIAMACLFSMVVKS